MDESPIPTNFSTPTLNTNKNKNQPHNKQKIENQQNTFMPQTNPTTTINPSPTEVPETPGTGLEEDQIRNNEIPMSPPVLSKNLVTNFTSLINKPDPEINETAKFCVQLNQDKFCDLGGMEKIPLVKRQKIIAKAMLLELGPYDPSDEYIINYKGKKL